MSKKYRPPVSPMFAESHEDLPLFSGAPLLVEENPWNPQARPEKEAPTADMFSEPAAAESEPAAAESEPVDKCQHLGDLRMRDLQEGGRHFYVAACPDCGRRGAQRRSTKGAAAALRRVLG